MAFPLLGYTTFRESSSASASTSSPSTSSASSSSPGTGGLSLDLLLDAATLLESPLIRADSAFCYHDYAGSSIEDGPQFSSQDGNTGILGSPALFPLIHNVNDPLDAPMFSLSLDLHDNNKDLDHDSLALPQYQHRADGHASVLLPRTTTTMWQESDWEHAHAQAQAHYMDIREHESCCHSGPGQVHPGIGGLVVPSPSGSSHRTAVISEANDGRQEHEGDITTSTSTSYTVLSPNKCRQIDKHLTIATAAFVSPPQSGTISSGAALHPWLPGSRRHVSSCNSDFDLEDTASEADDNDSDNLGGRRRDQIGRDQDADYVEQQFRQSVQEAFALKAGIVSTQRKHRQALRYAHSSARAAAMSANVIGGAPSMLSASTPASSSPSHLYSTTSRAQQTRGKPYPSASSRVKTGSKMGTTGSAIVSATLLKSSTREPLAPRDRKTPQPEAAPTSSASSTAHQHVVVSCSNSSGSSSHTGNTISPAAAGRSSTAEAAMRAACHSYDDRVAGSELSFSAAEIAAESSSRASAGRQDENVQSGVSSQSSPVSQGGDLVLNLQVLPDSASKEQANAPTLHTTSEVQQPHVKRAQTALSCLRCRSTHKKCDEQRPCKRCVRVGRYDCEDAPPRGIKVKVASRSSEEEPDDA